jgi:predicted DCC family thiol-disulfide oxidoreductase YuxK
VLAVPSQRPDLAERYGLSREQTDREAWAVDRLGRRWAGAAAINQALRQIGGPWPLIGRLYALPPLGWLERRVYRWVATHRQWLSRFWSTTPACDQPEGGCR